MKTQLKRSIHSYYESKLVEEYSRAEIFDAILGLSGALESLKSFAVGLYDEKVFLLSQVDNLSDLDLSNLASISLETMQDDGVLTELEDIFTLSLDRQKQAMLTAVRNVFLS